MSNINKQSLSYSSSITSSQCDKTEDMDALKVKNQVKQLLRSRIFLGRYTERRLISERIGYRDVVQVSSAEVDLKRDLSDARHKLLTVYPHTHWIGITEDDSQGLSPGVYLWTEIDNEPLGPFWFQVKSVKYRDFEVIVTVKCLRHISEAFLEVEPILLGSQKKSKEGSTEGANFGVTGVDETYKEIVATLKTALSITNVKEFFTFLLAFIIALFSGSTSFVNFVGNFVLALIREMSLFIKNSTPLFLGFLDFLSKIVGGFYILLAMFFKPNNRVPQNMRSIPYNQRCQSKQFDSSRYID